MSSRNLKRPSSARRHINYEQFNQFVSDTRLRRVQSLLKGGNQKEALDSILCITGIDSRYNAGCQHLVNYLLFDFFNSRKKELEQSGFAEEDLDDIIILINRESVDVYCNVINYHYLLPYTCHWDNVIYHCLTDDEAEDEELEEDFKILSFVSMVKGKKRVGIPYFSPGHGGKFDKFAVEKWPIIQAYGLEEIGGGGFFTMNNEVVDISKRLEEIYSLVDPVSVEALLTQKLKLLTRQWTDMETRFSLEIQDKMERLGEDVISEPLVNYFKHGRVIPLDASKQLRYPYVLLGTRSSQKEIEKSCREFTERYENIASCGLNSQPGSHMVCQAVSPNSALTCTRSYFFSPVFSPFKDGGDKEAREDLWCLVSLYQMMIEAVVAGIKSYSKTLSLTHAKASVWYVLEESVRQLDNPTINNYLHGNRSKIVFEINCVDDYGRWQDLEDGVYQPMIKTAMLSLYDLPSLVHDGKSVGSLVFSESFLDSSFSVKGSSKRSHDVIILTSNIPRFNTWAVRKNDLELCQGLPDRISQLDIYGERLVSGETILYTTAAPEYSQIYTGEITVYENAVIIHHKQYGTILLTHTDIQRLQIYDADTNSCVWLLVVSLDRSGMSRLPTHLHQDQRQLVLLLPPKAKIHKLLYSEILPNWKTESSFPSVERLDDVPKHLKDLYVLLEKQYISSKLNKVSKLEDSITHIPFINRFLSHLTVSTVGCQEVDESSLPYILNEVTDTDDREQKEDSEDDKIIVTVISGVIGSNQDHLSSIISRYNLQRYRWVVIKPSLDNQQHLDKNQLERNLTEAVGSHYSQTENMRTTRILLLKNSFTDVEDIIHTIDNHPDVRVRGVIKIGSVSVCVDARNFFLEHRVTYPGVLKECREGFVNNIILTSPAATQDNMTNDVQSLLRGVNSNVAFIPAERGEVYRSTDLDNILSSDNFHQPSFLRARSLSSPTWKERQKHFAKPEITQETLTFTPPLDKQTFVNKLKTLSSSLKPLPAGNNIYHVHGHLTFTGQDNVYEVEYVTLSGDIKLKPVVSTEDEDAIYLPPSFPPPSTNSLTFTGVNLQLDSLKDWTRACAVQKLEKKKLLKKDDLTKEEIAQIHKKKHLSPLPAGWFYNGSQFISLGGEKTSLHPNLESFIEEYLKTKNCDIEKHNLLVQTTQYLDLFD